MNQTNKMTSRLIFGIYDLLKNKTKNGTKHAVPAALFFMGSCRCICFSAFVQEIKRPLGR